MASTILKKLHGLFIRTFDVGYDDISHLRLTEAKIKKTNTEFIYKNKYGYYTYIDGDHFLGFIFEEQFPNDCFDIISYLENMDKQWDIVFDVGACRGVFSLYASIRAKQVIAFEPYEKNIKSMRRNISLNMKIDRLPDTIEIIEKAVSNHEGVICFYESVSYGHGSTRNINDGTGVKIEVPCTTIDIYCQEQNIDSIDLLKIDVEGGEIEVLNGAQRLLKNGKIGMIIFEASFTVMTDVEKGKSDIFSAFELLESYCYTVEDLDGNTVSKHMIKSLNSSTCIDLIARPNHLRA